MAIIRTNAVDLGSNGGSSNNLTVSYTNTGNCIVVFSSAVPLGGITSVTFNGIAFTQVGAADVANSGSQAFVLKNAPQITANIVLSLASTGTITAMAASYQGVASVNAVDNNGLATDALAQASYSINFSTAVDNAVAVGFSWFYNPTGPPVWSGSFTRRAVGVNNNIAIGDTATIHPAGTITFGLASTSGNWNANSAVVRFVSLVPATGYIFLTASSTFSPPGDWPGYADKIECLGSGGNGAAGSGTLSGGGGGGGEYAAETGQLVLAGGASFTVGTAGGATNTSISVTISGVSTPITAHPGTNASGITAGGGGTGSTNTIHLNGGSGSNGVSSVTHCAGGGGGGAGGPAGAGAGSATAAATAGFKGSGGGGDGSSGAATAGTAGTSATAGGAAGTPDGGAGGNGLAAAGTATAGSPGASALNWNTAHGVSGGGGGGGGNSGTTGTRNGGAGGNGGPATGFGYGGGAGGGGSATTAGGAPGGGMPGLIVISYTSIFVADSPRRIGYRVDRIIRRRPRNVTALVAGPIGFTVPFYPNSPAPFAPSLTGGVSPPVVADSPRRITYRTERIIRRRPRNVLALVGPSGLAAPFYPNASTPFVPSFSGGTAPTVIADASRRIGYRTQRVVLRRHTELANFGHSLELVVSPPAPIIPPTQPVGVPFATLYGVWHDGSKFGGNFAFAAPNFDDGGVYAITQPGGLGTPGSLSINPSGPGVGAGGNIENVTIVAIDPPTLGIAAAFYSNTVSATYTPALAPGTGNLPPPPFYVNTATAFFIPTLVPGAGNLAAPFYTNTISATYTPTRTPGTANVAAPFYTNTLGAIFVPALTPGAVNVAAPFYSNTVAATYVPAVTAGAVNITPPVYPNASTPFVPLLIPGTANVAAPFYTNTSAALYVPVPAPGAGSLAAPFYTNTVGAVYTPILTPGGAALGAPFYDNTAGTTIYALSIFGEGTVAPQLYDNTSQSIFYNAVVSGGTAGVSAPFYTSPSPVFFTPAFLGTASLAAPFYTDPDTWFAPTLTSGVVNIAAPFYSNIRVTYVPAFASTANISAPFYANIATEQIFTPQFTATANVSAPVYTNTNIATYAPALTVIGNVQAPFYSNTGTRFAPTLTPGAANLAVPFFTNASPVFYALILSGTGTVLAPFFANTRTYFTPALAVPTLGAITAPFFANSRVYFTPTVAVAAPINLSAPFYQNPNATLAPFVSPPLFHPQNVIPISERIRVTVGEI
jgi:hypothetical protein